MTRIAEKRFLHASQSVLIGLPVAWSLSLLKLVSLDSATGPNSYVMSITKLRATRIGVHTHRYLSEKSRTGSVVSTFRHGFNVLFDDDTDSRFVAFQTQDEPLHPWAVELPGTPPLLQAKMACFANGKSIRFSNGLIASFASAVIDKLHIQPWDQEETLHALHNESLVRANIQATLPENQPVRLEAEILTILVRGRLPDDAQTLVELIGRGTGSTPAGDDALLGMLAALMAQAASSHHARSQLAALRDKLQSVDLIKITTRASAQMLHAGLVGSFPEPLCVLATILKLANALDFGLQKSIDHVLHLGATSGWFMLMGFMAAIARVQDAAIEQE
jgi:Protein of unknown function (DUF2877)